MIRLIATDVDGTLVEEGSAVLPQELFSLIERLTDAGILFAAASGRQYRGLRRLFAPVADKIVFISENGSNVVCGKEEWYASVIDPAIVREMKHYVKKLPGCYLTLSTTGVMYSSGGQDEAYHRMMVEGYHNDMEFAEEMDTDLLKVIKMSIYCREGVASLTEELERQWGDRLTVAAAGKPWVDFSNPGTDKGAALKLIQERFGICREQTMAFGDNHNDIGMLRAAGESYAVATAGTAVKEAASHLAGGYMDRGVIRILEGLL